MNGDKRSPIQKFQSLLRELFQFDCADLDFGIYRIMNHKREVVERFISTKLPEAVDAELGSGALADQAESKAALEKARKQVIELLGADALDSTGDVTPALASTPVAKAYLAARDLAGISRSRDALEKDIYNHLYTFFNRYYQDGDFISKRRYSRNHRYAIPYNGEEVHLHWANSDQYYIKTTEHFHSYQWKSPLGVTIHFRVDSADVEQNNVKGESRYFLPRGADAKWDAGTLTLILPFSYRPLSANEKTENSRQQEGIIAAALEELPAQIKEPEVLAALTGEHSRNADDQPISFLEHHLRRYTRRNDSDFFIHKDLRAFLQRELDFYLKNEVLNLDNLQTAGEQAAEGWFQQLRLIKVIGGQIIEFLAQIEGFQKMLWEKRKLITEANYCIALRCVPQEFYAEIATNEDQWAEWLSLSLVGEELANSVDSSSTNGERIAHLQANGTLMLDTACFDSAFTDRLMGSLGDINSLMDGLLIESENSQALRFLQSGYTNQIKCIYIDPPYNTDASAILYKNGYKDSSWLSLVADGLTTAKSLLASDGILCCAIDDEEAWQLRSLMQSTFESELGIVTVRSNPAGRKSKGQFSPAHEYAYFYGAGKAAPGSLPKTKKELNRYPFADESGRYAWNNLVRHGSNDRREDRPKLFFPIYVDEDDQLDVPIMEWNEEDREYRVLKNPAPNEVAVWPVRIVDGQRIEKNWHRGPERIARTLDEYRVRRVEGTPGIEIDFKIHIDDKSMPKTWWDDSRYASANRGAKSLKDLFGDKNFDFPKAVGLVEDCLRASGCDGRATVLDYFAGSGTTAHAVINLNREDGGKRKFILVEMGDHFHTAVLPRAKKIAFSPEWSEGKPARNATAEEAERSPKIIKYIRLESYEDALDSIQFDQRAGELQLEDRIEGYLLNYMLKWETKDSETLLNPSKLTAPFDYQLRVHSNGDTVDRPVDVAETFNYLLGLKVRTRRVYMDGDRCYLVFRGETREQPGRTTVVIWRHTVDWSETDLERDREFVAENGITEGADTVFVNGMSGIVGGKPIEPLFKERMFAGVSYPGRPTNAKTNG